MIALFIYNLSIRLYYISVYIASFFSVKARSWIEGRKKAYKRLSNFISSAHGPRIWFHCASLGEFEQARPLIEKIKQQHPGHQLILTFFSPSGFDARRYYEGVDFVGYLPVDTPQKARRFIRKMKPALVIWVKYEYWYHILAELYKEQVPVVLISSVFRPQAVFFKWYGALHRKILSFFTHIFVQNRPSQALLQTIGLPAEVCPDTRFDRVNTILANHKQIDSVAAFKGDKKIFIAGSTWQHDADMLAKMINHDPFKGQFKYIIAPHNVNKTTVDYLIKKIKRKRTILSGLRLDNAAKYDVVVVDSIGLLASLYYYADMAYVGGGFNTSIHNILEPAVYGMPVFFGPNYRKSEEAKTLLAHPEWHAAYMVTNTNQLIAAVSALLEDNAVKLHEGSTRTKQFVQANTGGTQQIYNYLLQNGLL